MIQFKIVDKRYTEEHLGFLPMFLSPRLDVPAAQQLDINYQHGGGFHHFKGFAADFSGEPETWTIRYPGDPLFRIIAYAKLGEEIIAVFPHGPWVAVVQPDKSFVICRMD